MFSRRIRELKMIDDPIVKEIRKYRQEHSEKYEHDLKKICIALREQENGSEKKVVNFKPRLLLLRTGS